METPPEYPPAFAKPRLDLLAPPRLRLSYFLFRQAGQLEDRLCEFMTADSKSAYRKAFVALLLTFLAVSLLLLCTGAAVQRDDPWDTLENFEGARRVYLGLKPHADWYDHLGLTSHLPILVGMFLAGCRSQALAWGPAVLGPLVALGAWQLARVRFPVVPALIMALMIGGLVVGTFPLGYNAGWQRPSYQMQYNRFLWSLLTLEALALFLAPRCGQTSLCAICEGLSVGGIVGLLLLGKANYAVTALFLLGGAVVSGPRRSWAAYWLPLAAGLGLVLASYLVYMWGDIASSMRDLAILLGVQRSHSKIKAVPGLLLAAHAELYPLLFILLVFLRRMFRVDMADRALREGAITLLRMLVLVAAGLLACVGNAQRYKIPLWVVAAAILCEACRRIAWPKDRDAGQQAASEGKVRASPDESARLRALLGYAAASAALMSYVFADLGSVAYAFTWKHFKAASLPADAQFASQSLAGLYAPPASLTGDDYKEEHRNMTTTSTKTRKLSPYQYAIYVNSGLELLRGKVDEKSCVFTMDSSNPFPVALQLSDPRGPLVWDDGLLVDREHHPDMEPILERVTHVMRPKQTIATESNRLIEEVCGQYVADHFECQAESDLWILYVRKRSKSEAR
jgi:hypothetical protein